MRFDFSRTIGWVVILLLPIFLTGHGGFSPIPVIGLWAIPMAVFIFFSSVFFPLGIFLRWLIFGVVTNKQVASVMVGLILLMIIGIGFIGFSNEGDFWGSIIVTFIPISAGISLVENSFRRFFLTNFIGCLWGMLSITSGNRGAEMIPFGFYLVIRLVQNSQTWVQEEY